MKRSVLIILLMVIAFAIQGQTSAPEPVQDLSIQVVSDSLAAQKKLEIMEEYGIKETSKLSEVAVILGIRDIGKWKHMLGLEARNQKLNEKSLRQLSVTPYEAFLASQTYKYGFNELNTLKDVAKQLDIPLKKLKAMLGGGFDPLSNTDDERSLQSLNIEPERIRTLQNNFEEGLVPYSIVLTIVGMLVVFTALLITSIVISQMIHLNRERKKPAKEIKIDHKGKIVKSPAGVNRDIVVAALTALYIYEHNIKERRRLQLTFNRSKSSSWRSSTLFNMPNREYKHKRN